MNSGTTISKSKLTCTYLSLDPREISLHKKLKIQLVRGRNMDCTMNTKDSYIGIGILDGI